MQFKLEIFGDHQKSYFKGHSFYDRSKHPFKIFFVTSHSYGYQVWNGNIVLSLSEWELKYDYL